MEGGDELLSRDIYEMITQDLSSRTNSGSNFSSLVNSPAPGEQTPHNNRIQHPYQYNQSAYIQPVEDSTLHIQNRPNIEYPDHLQNGQLGEQMFDIHPAQHGQQENQPDQNYHDRQLDVPWDGVTETSTDVSPFGIEEEGSSVSELLLQHSIVAADEIPSLQPWKGQYNFTATVEMDIKDRNKWCYSQTLNKLYVTPELAVPIDIFVNPMIEGYIRITPVFKQSQHIKEPVARCYNCKSKCGGDPQMKDYIVQIESNRRFYEVLPDERHVVTVPLAYPPPGGSYSTILCKIMCMTSCVGGPNRRPFCLVLTLHCSQSGRVIGRQVLEVKCCKCPSRDMGNDEGKVTRNDTSSDNTARTRNLDERTGERIRELASQIKVGQKRKKTAHTFELEIVTSNEPRVQSGFVNIAVPKEFEEEVKRYINGLMATRHLSRNRPDLLLYPEADKTDTESD